MNKLNTKLNTVCQRNLQICEFILVTKSLYEMAICTASFNPLGLCSLYVLDLYVLAVSYNATNMPHDMELCTIITGTLQPYTSSL